MVNLSDLVARLQANVPAQNSVPSTAQYEQAIKDAVDDFSNRLPMRKRTTLSIVANTASYDLPDDFLRAISLRSLLAQDNVLVTDAGIVPVSDSFQEEYSVSGGQITFYPTPTYTTDRYLWYAAAYILDDDIYQDMTNAIAGVIMLLAQSLALGLQANAQASAGWSYKIGDVAVDKKGVGKGIQSQADSLEKQYLGAVDKMIGPVGMRSQYDYDVVTV